MLLWYHGLGAVSRAKIEIMAKITVKVKAVNGKILEVRQLNSKMQGKEPMYIGNIRCEDQRPAPRLENGRIVLSKPTMYYVHIEGAQIEMIKALIDAGTLRDGDYITVEGIGTMVEKDAIIFKDVRAFTEEVSEGVYRTKLDAEFTIERLKGKNGKYAFSEEGNFAKVAHPRRLNMKAVTPNKISSAPLGGMFGGFFGNK